MLCRRLLTGKILYRNKNLAGKVFFLEYTIKNVAFEVKVKVESQFLLGFLYFKYIIE